MYKIAFGCDSNTGELKRILIACCERAGHNVEDLGGDPIYANTAIRVAEHVVSGKADRGF